VLFTDNSYKFLLDRQHEWERSEVFTTHWDTLKIFAYRDIELKDLPTEMELKLVESLDEYHCPVMGRIVSKYGPRGRRNHNGIDLGLKNGEPIYATFPGRVRYSTYNTGGFGNLIILRHPNGLETYYAHLSRMNVRVGDWVAAGEVIGYGGNTGRSTGPHLHFETRLLGKALNPAWFFDFPNQDVTGDTYLYTKPKKKVYDPSDPDTYYKVRSGDSLSRIAARKGVSVKQLCKLNGITTQTTLRVGQILRLY
jgi:murein DD-endopeptidase MepM/ murein hydrolase activator NlpD